MIKALIIGADAVAPNYIFDNSVYFPNIAKMVESGASSAYSAYVQKGYQGSYLSEMNWSSIYTGLSPQEHKISALADNGKRNTPEMVLFSTLAPFWQVLNQNGISVGMWSADCCVNPIEIDGYVISAKYSMISEPTEIRIASRELQVCEKDKRVLECLPGNPPPRIYPKTLEQQGYTYAQLKEDDELAWEVVNKYHFQDAILNFQEELDYYFESIKTTQEKYPVDVLYFYTPTTDLIAHCCMYCDNNDVLIQAYQLLDEFIGKLVEELLPETTVFLSDHGMINFKELICCSDPAVQREAFAARDEVLWLKNGSIAFKAHNGALLFTAHALKGTFIISGKGIKHTRLTEMRTLDIYPTLLELFRIKADPGRAGFVLDIFDRTLQNESRLLKENGICYETIAFIQGHQPSITDIMLNELYIENRFSKITVVGNERYKEIFLNNPRVSGFVSYEAFDADEYKEVYCGVYNETTGEIRHMRIK